MRLFTLYSHEISSVIVSHLLHVSLIHKFRCVRTEPLFPICNLLPVFGFVFPFAVFLMYSLPLPSESFGSPPPPPRHPVCSSDLSTKTCLLTPSCCRFSTKPLYLRTLFLSTSLSLFFPEGMSPILPPTTLVSANQHFPCHNRWLLIFTYSSVMTFSVYFIHGPQLLLLQLCSLSAKNPINLSAISALFFAQSDNGAYPGFFSSLLLINWHSESHMQNETSLLSERARLGLWAL